VEDGVTTNCIVNVSYCCYRKVPEISRSEHARWLHHTVSWLRGEVDWPIVVSMIGWNGMIRMADDEERRWMMRTWRLARFTGVSEHLDHQGGAGTAIHMGLVAAEALGAPFLVHTAEDILPTPGALDNIHLKLEFGADYVGAKWGHKGEFLNAQFFGCRRSVLARGWDAGTLTGAHHTEMHLRECFEGAAIEPEGQIHPDMSACRYNHTHDWALFQTWLEQPPGEKRERGNP
jgi:hypothetical protein